MNRNWIVPGIMMLMTLAWSETYSFSGDKSFSVMRKGEEVTTIEGNVEIRSDRKEIFAGAVSIRGMESPEFDGSGSVTILDREKGWELKAWEFSYSPGSNLLRARGDIRFEDKENNLYIRCQVMTVYEKKDQILMEVGVRLFKDDLICRSQYAIYQREGNILELTGFPVVYKGEDLYRADRIRVNLDTSEITMTGRIEGSLVTSQQETGTREESDD